MADGRVNSDIFVSALMRSVEQRGGFATVVRKGDPRGGAVHILMTDYRAGTASLFAPAPQAQVSGDTEDGPIGGRLFTSVQSATDADAIETYMAREARFDSDFWLIELEIDADRSHDLFSVTA